MKYQAVIFDLFGTLVDNFSLGEYDDVFSRMATTLSAPKDDFIRLWKEGFRDRATGVHYTTMDNINHICKQLNVTPGYDALKEVTRIRIEFTRRALSPRKDAIYVLESLRSLDLKTGLITDCSSEVPRLWGETPFLPLFDATVFSCETGLKKPDPKIYRLACEKLHVDPENCLYVGDGSSHELSGAQRVKMDPVLIQIPAENNEDAYRIDDEDWDGIVIRSLVEVLEIVR